MDLCDWRGARLTGFEGAKLVTAFNTQLSEKSRLNASQFMKQELKEYAPWMSSFNLDKFSILNSSAVKLLVDNEEHVNIQRNVFSSDDCLNLKELDPLAQENVTVMSTTSPQWSRFKTYVENYYSIAKKSNPYWLHRVQSLINQVIPMEDVENSNKLRKNGSGLSTLKYRNAIFLSLPEYSDVSFFEFCLNFSHELGHQALMTYEHYDDLVKVDQNAYIYSVIRETNRPAIQSLHALIAVVYMLEFIHYSQLFFKVNTPLQYIEERTRELREDLSVGLEEFKTVPLTSLGKQIIVEIRAFEMWLSRDNNAA